MSKSKLTGIAPTEITDVFGADAYRFYFLSAIPFGHDGSFSWEDLSARYQAELANGFGELTDPAEQRRRFEADMDEKARIYGERYPLDEDFMTALGAMPEASGVALGLDRLVMLAAGAERIADVIWTPVA